MRLEDDVAIAENGGGAPSTDMFDSFERFSTEPFGERIIEEETGELKQVEIVRIFEPVFLKRAEVIGIAEVLALLLENAPVGLRATRANLPFQKGMDIAGDAVVVEQGVIDVEKEDHACPAQSGKISSGGA